MKNIVLVGFMATGKTVTARALAKRLGLRYISIDALIEKKEKRKISDIFAECGEEYFRKVETDIIKEVSRQKNIVIDAGGGAVIKEENVKNFKKNSVIICLTASSDVILERTKNEKGVRPLLNVANPKQTIEELLAKRQPYYAKADFTVDTSGFNADEVVNKILVQLDKFD